MEEPLSNNGDLVCIGKITSAHGIKGNVKIKSYTDNPEDIVEYGAIFDDSGKSVEITITSSNRNMLIARITGVNDRNKAEELRDTKLFTSRDNFPELEEDEHYHIDLIGLAVKDIKGNIIGKVKAMNNFGAGDIMEIHINETGKDEMILFKSDTVIDVNIGDGYITVDLPEEVIVQPGQGS